MGEGEIIPRIILEGEQSAGGEIFKNAPDIFCGDLIKADALHPINSKRSAYRSDRVSVCIEKQDIALVILAFDQKTQDTLGIFIHHITSFPRYFTPGGGGMSRRKGGKHHERI